MILVRSDSMTSANSSDPSILIVHSLYAREKLTISRNLATGLVSPTQTPPPQYNYLFLVINSYDYSLIFDFLTWSKKLRLSWTIVD